VKRPLLLLAALLLIAPLVSVARAVEQPLGDSSDFTPLNNKDILEMVQRKVETQAIVLAIQSSPCTFDTFPPVLLEMKRRGVPEVVLVAMVEAPYGPSLQSISKDDLAEEPIYHYAEQLKAMGILSPSSGRRSQAARQSRARASRRQRF
jgi:hypothetical protein